MHRVALRASWRSRSSTRMTNVTVAEIQRPMVVLSSRPEALVDDDPGGPTLVYLKQFIRRRSNGLTIIDRDGHVHRGDDLVLKGVDAGFDEIHGLFNFLGWLIQVPLLEVPVYLVSKREGAILAVASEGGRKRVSNVNLRRLKSAQSLEDIRQEPAEIQLNCEQTNHQAGPLDVSRIELCRSGDRSSSAGNERSKRPIDSVAQRAFSR